MPHLQPFLRLFVCTAVALLAACASSGGAGRGSASARMVTLLNFKSGERFELASESHTDRVAYYSDERRDAVRKIQADDVMAAFAQELERQGFADHAQPGRAPAVASSEVIRWGLEIEQGEQRRHWLIGTGSPVDDWQEFQKCRDAFLELYNITVSFQTVKNQSGKQFFEDQKPASSGKK